MMLLNHAQIKAILPHRYPMLLVDTVLALEPGEYIVATKNITGNEPCFSHLTDSCGPRSYAYPPSLILESFGQAASIIYCADPRQQVGRHAQTMLFGAATHCRFEGEVFPGDTLEHRARLDLKLSNAAVFSGEVWVMDKRIVEIERIVVALRAIPEG